MVIGVGSMMIGIAPSDQLVNLLAIGVGIVWAIAPGQPSIRDSATTQDPTVER